jgi:ADP-heptose:LPS heptosyltransferase
VNVGVSPFTQLVRSGAPAGATLPAVFLSRYLFFLTQRPISRSNTRYLRRRIHALQSLGALLGEEHELLATATRLLRILDPVNLHEFSERLQLELFPFARAELPTRYVSADAEPPMEFVGTCERVLLLLGPAIGIGDEIVTFPLPLAIKGANPRASVRVLTGYEGLWDDVPGVDAVSTYESCAAVVDELRGSRRPDSPDLVLFVDFENPDLYRAVCGDTELPRYAELSLGARSLVAVDNAAGWVFHQSLPRAYFRNVYDGFHELARRLGLAPAAHDPVDRGPAAAPGSELRIFVSPFSSKYDPAPHYWTTLLATLVPVAAGRPVRFVLDPGPSTGTRRVAEAIARAAGGRAPAAVQVGVAAADGRRGLSLPGVFGELRRADVVVCADSFAAHAAARAGCTALVLATPGLEDWRVPIPRNYYFDAEAPIGTVVSGMRQVLELHGVHGDGGGPRLGAVEERLAQAEAGLAAALGDGASFAELRDAYERFRRERVALGSRVAGWPAEAAALAGDHAYEQAPRELGANGALPRELERDVRRFIENEWRTWRNTNVRKYLELRRQAVPG